MNFLDLKNAIQTRVGTTYFNLWTIGTTNDCSTRKEELETEHKDCRFWEDYEADNDAVARCVQEYFQRKGMRTDRIDEQESKYIYVF